MNQCKVCGKNIEPQSPHFILAFNKKGMVEGELKIISSEEAAVVCEDCGEEGLRHVLWNLKLIHDSDTELEKKMRLIEERVKIEDLMKEYGISGEKVGVNNQYLARCPFHNQENSFLIDLNKNEYFCFCEGLQGDVISFIINYARDIDHKHMTLKQAVDFLLDKFAPAER